MYTLYRLYATILVGIYGYLGAGIAGVWPRCDPVIFNCWQVHQTHDDNKSKEFLEFISVELLPRPLMYTGAWCDRVSFCVLCGVQTCLTDDVVQDGVSYQHLEVVERRSVTCWLSTARPACVLWNCTFTLLSTTFIFIFSFLTFLDTPILPMITCLVVTVHVPFKFIVTPVIGLIYWAWYCHPVLHALLHLYCTVYWPSLRVGVAPYNGE